MKTKNRDLIVTFESVEEILRRDYSNESHWAVLSNDIIYVVLGGSKFRDCRWNRKVWRHLRSSLEGALKNGAILSVLFCTVWYFTKRLFFFLIWIAGTQGICNRKCLKGSPLEYKLPCQAINFF